MKTRKTNHSTNHLRTPSFSCVDHSWIDSRSMPSLVAWSSFLWVIHGRNWKAAWIYIVRRTTRNRFWERHVFLRFSCIDTCIYMYTAYGWYEIWYSMVKCVYIYIYSNCRCFQDCCLAKCKVHQSATSWKHWFLAGINQAGGIIMYYLVGTGSLVGKGSWLVTCQLCSSLFFLL